MRIRLAVERLQKEIQLRIVRSRLERMAGDRGPDSYRTPEFLAMEVELGVVLAELARVEYESSREETAERRHSRAEQIYTALYRFLPHASLEDAQRTKLEDRLRRLQQTLASLQDLCTAA